MTTQTEARAIRPRTDVFETDEALVLVADVPGADQDSVELSLTDDVLVLCARPVSRAPEGWQPAGSEYELCAYERSFRLSAEIDREGIDASITNGRLRVTLKKRAPCPGRIPVQTK